MSPPPTTIDNTLGALLVGAFFSMTLWGVTCTQAYDYFMNNADRRLQRSIVALLLVIDTLVSLMHTHIAYHLLVTSFGNISSIQKSTWSLKLQPFIIALENNIIRCMFSRQIYQFNQRNIIVPAWIVLISTCELVDSLVITTKGFQGYFPLSKYHLEKLLWLSFFLGVTADLSVTIALCWLLHSSKSGFQKSNSVINILMAYMVNTGLLVTTIVTVGLITYIVMPRNLVYIVCFMLGCKLYLNAYLAALNARGRLRAALHTDASIPLSQLRATASQGRDTQGVLLSDVKTGSFPTSTLAISLQRTVETDEVKNHNVV